jgi:hypothetical protein
MNLEQLKTRHPKVFRTFVADGVQRERARILAHIKLGEESGDMGTTLAAIESGATMTPEIFQAHLAAGRNRADIADREADDEAVLAAIENAADPPSTHVDPFERAVADRFVELLDTSAGEANIEDLEEA